MERLRIGYRVCDVRGRLVGSVTALASCCFELQEVDGGQVRLTQHAIFTVEDARVTLLCDRTGLPRYECELDDHQARAEEPL